MKIIDYNRLLKEKGPKKILNLFSNWKINLTDKQLENCIKLKNEEERKGFLNERRKGI